MEKLGHLIQSAVEEGRWKPIKLARSSPLLSHLFFADDLILFGKASLDQIHVWTVLNLSTGCQVKRLMMGHGVDSYLVLNEIGSLNPMMNFIIINYLFNYIFGFIR